MMERTSLFLTASVTSVVVVTGCPFMLTITSWFLNPELGGRGKKDHEIIKLYLPSSIIKCLSLTDLLTLNTQTRKQKITSILPSKELQNHLETILLLKLYKTDNYMRFTYEKKCIVLEQCSFSFLFTSNLYELQVTFLLFLLGGKRAQKCKFKQ